MVCLYQDEYQSCENTFKVKNVKLPDDPENSTKANKSFFTEHTLKELARRCCDTEKSAAGFPDLVVE